MTTSHSLAVLIVEDHPDGADSLAELLTMCGHTVRVARSVADALAGLPEEPPNVILLDVGLPDGDGYSLARTFDALRPRPLLVALTGYPNLEGTSRSVGIDHHFLKPVEPERLTDLLASHADRLAGRTG